MVEDDDAIGGALVAALAGQGHEVRWARTARQAEQLLREGAVDLVLLDLGLPDGDGVELCGRVRASDEQVVVLVVTARAAEADAVRALDAGADDVVLKPFRLSELLARVRAHLRRRETAEPADLRVGLLRVDLRARRCFVGDLEVLLRPKELDLLCALAGRAGTAVRREQLMDEVWDEHWSGSTKTLDVHVASLRRKLAEGGDRWDRIGTLRGYGYRYEAD